MRLQFDHPNDFDPGVYVVRIMLNAAEMEACGNADFSFELPQHSSWLFRVFDDEQSFIRPATATERGSFVGVFRAGQWRMIVQSNGVTEDRNPVNRSSLEQELRSAIEQRLKT